MISWNIFFLLFKKPTRWKGSKMIPGREKSQRCLRVWWIQGTLISLACLKHGGTFDVEKKGMFWMGFEWHDKEFEFYPKSSKELFRREWNHPFDIFKKITLTKVWYIYWGNYNGEREKWRAREEGICCNIVIVT